MIAPRLAGLVLALAAAAVSAPPARAERLVISLSTHRVLIASNFTGADLVLFGAVEIDAATVGRRGYDVVVTVRGPRQRLVTRRKDRVLGIWVNIDSRTFIEPPSYLTVLTNTRVDAIASPDALRRFQIGLQNTVLPQDVEGDIADVQREDPFRTAFLRLMQENDLYREVPNGVTFLTPTLFRAGVELPANVPIGSYEVDVKLFSDGALLARDVTAFETVKTGFEQYVANAAREHGILYGLSTTAMALLTGWLAAIIFRRD